jgi:hypothetical protein
MEMAGTPCPYMGKIGLEAAQAWLDNPEKRPDYDKWVKENTTEEEFLSDEDSAILGISGLIILLLLL